MFNIGTILRISTLALVVSACAGYDKPQISVLPIEEYQHRVNVDGISMAAEPYNTADKATLVFDEDLTAKGYYPINVVIRNDTDDRLLILKKTLALIDGSGVAYQPIDATLVAEDVDDNKMADGFLDFDILSFASTEEVDEERKSHYAAEQMAETMVIRPGQVQNGITYFYLPAGIALDGMTLHIDAEHMGSDRTTELALAF